MDQVLKVIADAAAWAKQSIIFAISIRAYDTSKEIEHPQAVTTANDEAEHLANELWRESQEECGEDAMLNAVMRAYVRKVFEWTHRHMNPE